MSYQVIARKWRPQTFEEVTGQEVITQTLRNALEFDRLHHAYLFSGARGVGKTTTARILAKALNCHKTDGKPNLTPCLLTDPAACPSCIEISESRSMDVLEIDAASHTGIDDVRGSIIDNINFNPARDRYKVFIIDEVHQLSKPAFNALLKTLEEPPGNVVFVMATTELHKVPETILSRCQEFEFRIIPLQKIFDRLKLIASAEKIDITDDALRELARSGEGSMRDAQSNFDQVISFSSDKIEAKDVTNALGFAGVEILTRTITAISQREPSQILSVVDDLISRGYDLRNFCRDLLGLIRDLMVQKVSGENQNLVGNSAFSTADLTALGGSFSEADLIRFFTSLCETEAGLREAIHPRYVLEIGLVKLIEMRKVATIESILERLDSLSAGTSSSTKPASENPQARSLVIEEKKTLIIEPTGPDEIHRAPAREELPVEPEGLFQTDEDRLQESRPEREFIPAAAPRERAANMVVRLPRLSSEELEHYDDKRLDESYEEKMANVDDDLMPVGSIREFVRAYFGELSKAAASVAHPSANGSRTAVAPAYDISKFRDEISPKLEDVELPILSDDPTDDELMAYAKAHPAVRAAMRVFRGKIIEIKRK